MTTAADLITLALKDIQVLDESETPSAALMADGLVTLNQILAQWQTDKLYVYAQVKSGFTANGAASYTVGIGGNFNFSSPSALDSVFYTKNNVDYPVDQLSTFEEYQAIAYKSINGFPSVAYYNPTNNLASLYLYPKPLDGTINIVYPSLFPIYATSADSINLPAVYEIAVRFSLAEILSLMMGKVLRPDITQQALKARKFLKRSAFRLNRLDSTPALGHLAIFYQG